jgi:AraC-like DNA-binding protein/CheY-like chemotaxis protein
MDKNPVLIITDRPSLQYYNAFSIGGEKIKVIQYSHSPGKSKWEKADLVVLDCGDETGQGMKLLREVKSTYKQTPVIFLTDVQSDDIAVRAYRNGARIFFHKPVDFFELRSTVENMLKAKRTCREERTVFFADDNRDTDAPVSLIDPDMPENILRTIIYIEDNLSSVMNLDTLAKKATLSKYHFSRLFKKFTGMSPLEFVKIFRINKAKELLRKKNYTVSMVAEETGFNDLSHFERNFKQLTGSTPRLYRQSVKNQRDHENNRD